MSRPRSNSPSEPGGSEETAVVLSQPSSSTQSPGESVSEHSSHSQGSQSHRQHHSESRHSQRRCQGSSDSHKSNIRPRSHSSKAKSPSSSDDHIRNSNNHPPTQPDRIEATTVRAWFQRAPNVIPPTPPSTSSSTSTMPMPPPRHPEAAYTSMHSCGRQHPYRHVWPPGAARPRWLAPVGPHSHRCRDGSCACRSDGSQTPYCRNGEGGHKNGNVTFVTRIHPVTCCFLAVGVLIVATVVVVGVVLGMRARHHSEQAGDANGGAVLTATSVATATV